MASRSLCYTVLSAAIVALLVQMANCHLEPSKPDGASSSGAANASIDHVIQEQIAKDCDPSNLTCIDEVKAKIKRSYNNNVVVSNIVGNQQPSYAAPVYAPAAAPVYAQAAAPVYAQAAAPVYAQAAAPVYQAAAPVYQAAQPVYQVQPAYQQVYPAAVQAVAPVVQAAAPLYQAALPALQAALPASYPALLG